MVRLGVREQIILVSCIPLAFLIALLGIGFALRSESMQSAAAARQVTDMLAKANRVYDTMNDVFSEVKDYHADRSQATLRRYRATTTALPAEIADLELAGESAASRARARRFAGDAANVSAILDRILVLERQNNTRAIAALSKRPEVLKLGPEYLAAKTALDDGEQSDARAHDAVARRRINQLSTALVLLGIIAVAVTLALAIGFGLRTGRRLRRLVENALLLARHKPTVPIEGNDEIAEIDRVYHDMSRELEETTVLQHALLPQRLPEIPGLRLDSAYIPAAMHGKVGGDWFDVFPIDGTLVGISIGDVAGHGLTAASTMAMLRQTIRVTARLEQQPSQVLRQANQSLCADDPGALATAAFATLDRTTGQLRWSDAGHPPPILVRPDRTVTLLDGEGLMFGVDRQATFGDYTLQLEVGSALVFYTDGLVEVNRDYAAGLQALESAVLAEYQESSVEFAENVQRRIFSHTAPSDDSALLFVGVSALGAAANDDQHVWQFDARDAVSAQRVKRALLWELATHANRSPEFAAIEIIYGELLANVARHTPGPATITLQWHDQLPVLHIDDHGPAFQLPLNAPADKLAETGRGFRLIANCASKVAVQRIGEKNRVTVALPLCGQGSGRSLEVRAT